MSPSPPIDSAAAAPQASIVQQLTAATEAVLASMPRTMTDGAAARAALEASVSRHLVALGEPTLAQHYLARCRQHGGKRHAALS